eukprot:TRINITY_DN62_c0_g4_i2.p1 TRINITY_DN62_c0_g4~~TRINITY_DN62_c0_g4_i2.p1  ORF type:complete len:1647 (+),score=502.07 TRINITY_DN62_c0_g4_i2:93-5033(+)
MVHRGWALGVVLLAEAAASQWAGFKMSECAFGGSSGVPYVDLRPLAPRTVTASTGGNWTAHFRLCANLEWPFACPFSFSIGSLRGPDDACVPLGPQDYYGSVEVQPDYISLQLQPNLEVRLRCAATDRVEALSVSDSQAVVLWETEHACPQAYPEAPRSVFLAVAIPALVIVLGVLLSGVGCGKASALDGSEPASSTWEEPPGMTLAWRQLTTLVRKNLLLLSRGWLLLLTVVVAPAVTIGVACIVMDRLSSDLWDTILIEQNMGLALLSIAALVIYIAVLNSVVYEKQAKITSLMRMVGVSELAYWTSWVIAWGIVAVPTALFTSIIACVSNLKMLRATEPSLFLVVSYLFVLSVMTLAIFSASYVCKPRLVNTLAFLVFMAAVQVTVQFTTRATEESGDINITDPSKFAKFVESAGILQLLCVMFPWLNFMRIFHQMALLAGPGGPGMYWSDATSDMPHGCADCGWNGKVHYYHQAGLYMFFLFISVPLYIALAWYVAQVAGGELRQPLYFLFTREYWTGRATVEVQDGDTVARVQQESKQDGSIRLHKLSKAYKSVTALKEVSLQIDTESIFSVLGHNGAGKTTMVHTLCGFHSPTNGHAFFQGRSIREEMRGIQKTMGYCPQYDCLWDRLTALEHVRCYAGLKGAPPSRLDDIARQILADCDLGADADGAAGSFSGGMRRRLSVCVSATGSPSVMFLDEPTTGMDPLHRRQVWALIQRLKRGRIIVLTTHLMEEADCLSDNIAILSGGKLRACGTPLYLKNQFGSGYQISLQSEEGVDGDAVNKFVSEALPGSQVVSASAGNFCVSIGMNRRALIPRFFRKVEASEKMFKSWALSNTTLEEVFLKLCANQEVNAGGNDRTEDDCVSAVVGVRSEVEALEGDESENPFLLLHPGHRPRVAKTVPSWPLERATAAVGTLGDALYSILYPVKSREEAERKQQEMQEKETEPIPSDGDDDDVLCARRDQPQHDAAAASPSASAASGVPVPVAIPSNRVDMRSSFGSQCKALVMKAVWLQLCQKKTMVFLVLFSLVSLLFTVLAGVWLGDDKVSPGSASMPAIFFAALCYFLVPGQMHVVSSEKGSRLYFMLRLQGMTFLPYWIAHYCTIMFVTLLPAIVLLACGHAFKVKMYTEANPGLFLLAFVVWGNSSAAVSVLSTAVVRNTKLIVVFGLLILLCSISATSILISVVDTIPSPWFLVPPVGSIRSVQLLMIYGNHVLYNYTKDDQGSDWASDPSDVHKEFRDTLWIQAVFCTLALLPLGLLLHAAIPNEFGVSELRWRPFDNLVGFLHRAFIRSREPQPSVGEAARCLDVDPESQAAAPQPEIREDDVLIIDGLTQRYATGKLAVDNFTLSMHPGEVLGLLGPNGAGKTTALSVISGLMRPTGGTASVVGFDCVTESRKVHDNLGVCPQFDAVWDDLTVSQHIRLFGMLKGAPAGRMKGLVQSLAEAVHLDGDAFNQAAKGLSGGMRRRLSIAIALVGGPAVVLLDEPSTGLDPDARRKMWEIVEHERRQGRSIVLTTHSMEEADTLSTRIAIMSRGRLRALGDSMELKRVHGGGFRLGLTLTSADKEVPTDLLKELSPDGASLVYRFGKTRTYVLPQHDLRLSAVFEVLDGARAAQHIREWGLSQATLDEVFCRVAGEQMHH